MVFDLKTIFRLPLSPIILLQLVSLVKPNYVNNTKANNNIIEFRYARIVDEIKSFLNNKLDFVVSYISLSCSKSTHNLVILKVYKWTRALKTIVY